MFKFQLNLFVSLQQHIT